jgi:CRP-like cAMP-binding protein
VLRSPIKTQSFLANLPLFAELAPAELEPIAAGTTELHVPRGEIIFRRGDPCVGFHLVVYGQVKLAVVASDGAEKVVEIIGPGGSFGEALMFMEMPYILMAQALADSLLLHVAKSVVFDRIEREPRFARKMLAGMSRKLHRLISDIEAYSLQSSMQRLIGYLLRQHEGNEDSMVMKLPASKTNIASRLNVTPEHFSRMLHELAERGLIEVDGRNVTFLDLDRLRAFPS